MKPAQPQSTSLTSELLAAAVGAFRFPALESHRRRHSVLTSWVAVDFRNPPSYWIQTGPKRVQEKTSLERWTNKIQKNFQSKNDWEKKHILKNLPVKCPPFSIANQGAEHRSPWVVHVYQPNGQGMALAGSTAVYQPIKVHESWYQFWGVQVQTQKVESAALSYALKTWNPVQISQGTLKGICPKAVVAGSDRVPMPKAGIKPLALANPDRQPTSLFVILLGTWRCCCSLIHANPHCWNKLCSKFGIKAVQGLEYQTLWRELPPSIPVHTALQPFFNVHQSYCNCMLRTTSLWRIAAETSVLKILQNVPLLVIYSIEYKYI